MDNNDEVLFYKNKLLIDIIRDINTTNNQIQKNIREKIRKILSTIDLTMHLYNSNNSNIFGLSAPVLEELTFSEQKLLQNEVERHILEKYPKQFDLYDEMISGSLNKDTKKSKDDILSDEQTKLIELSEIYVKKLSENAEQLVKMCDMMNIWIEKRQNDTIDRNTVTIQYYQIKNKILELKAKIIEVQLSLSVYSNHGSSLAYMEINKDITKKMDILRNEVISYKKILHEDL